MALPAEMPALDGGAAQMQPSPVEGTNIAAEKLAFVAAPTALRHTRRSGYPVQLTASTDTAVRPLYDQPVYKAYADTKLVQATVTTQIVRFSVKYLYTSNGYLSALVNGLNNARILWQVNKSISGSDPAGDIYEQGMDAYGSVTDAIYGSSINSHFGYDGGGHYLRSIGTTAGSTTYQAMSYAWSPTGNLLERKSGAILTEDFTYDLHNRVLSSSVTNGTTNSDTGYQYDSVGDITHKSETISGVTTTTDYTYGYSGTHPHAVATLAVSAATTGSYAYDANGNMTCRDASSGSCAISGPTLNVMWDSDNQPSSITQDSGNYSNFFYGPDKHRYRQDAKSGGVASTTLYVGGLEIVTDPTGIDYKHTLVAYGRPVVLDELQANTSGAPLDKRSYLLTDHLGSVEQVVPESGTIGVQSFDTFGRHRDPGTWQVVAGSSTTITKHGFTDQEHLDNLTLVHMNGRVYDPVIGRFMSVDPVFQAPTNTQSVNPYSYVMNNPLSLVDPSGYAAACTPDSEGNTTACQADTTGDRLYKGHNDTGSMDHLAGTKLAAFDKAVQNRLDGGHGVLDHGKAAISWGNGKDGGQKPTDLDIFGKLPDEKGKPSLASNVSTAAGAGEVKGSSDTCVSGGNTACLGKIEVTSKPTDPSEIAEKGSATLAVMGVVADTLEKGIGLSRVIQQSSYGLAVFHYARIAGAFVKPLGALADFGKLQLDKAEGKDSVTLVRDRANLTADIIGFTGVGYVPSAVWTILDVSGADDYMYNRAQQNFNNSLTTMEAAPGLVNAQNQGYGSMFIGQPH